MRRSRPVRRAERWLKPTLVKWQCRKNWRFISPPFSDTKCYQITASIGKCWPRCKATVVFMCYLIGRIKKNYPSIVNGFLSVCRKTFLHDFPLFLQMEWLVRCLQKHYSPDFRQRVAKRKWSQRWEHRTYTLAILGSIFWWKGVTSVTFWLSVYEEIAFLTLEYEWKLLIMPWPLYFL